MNKTETTPSTRHERRSRLDLCALIIVFGAVLYGICACSRNDGYVADHGIPPCEITAPMDSIFSALFDSDGKEPGALVMVMHGDSIIYDHAFGYARLDKPVRITDSTVFNVSSISKLFTGVSIIKLMEQGLIGLDDTLSQYFPSFPKEYFGQITVRHMLSHSSGLPDVRPIGESEWKEYLEKHSSVFGFDFDYRRYGTAKEFINSLANLDTIAFEAGTHYDRRDVSYILAVPLLEKVTGQDFETWVSENLIKPAGLSETFYFHTDHFHEGLAHGYRPANPETEPISFRSEDGKWDEYDYGEADYFLTKSDRGLCSSGRDLMKFRRALRDGLIISKESREKMLSPVIPTDVDYVDFCLGTAVRRIPGTSPKAYHLNMNGGFAVLECWWPEGNVDYLVLSNRNDWPQRKVAAAVDSILESHGWVD